MKKLFVLFICTVFFTLNTQTLTAQNAPQAGQQTTDSSNNEEENAATTTSAEPKADAKKESGEKLTLTQNIKNKFIEGDPIWMAPVLLCLLLGLAIIIEKLLSLSLSSINAEKFSNKMDDVIKSRGLEAAREEARNTKGPIASIYYQGIDRAIDGSKVEEIESAVQSYGSVEISKLEKGMVWISLFIALAPMLGFMGTVIGMIQAFDDIAKAGDISATIVAGGIKVALLTTVAGLIVAIVLQIFYNLLMSKIDAIATDMEESSVSLIDSLVKSKTVR